MLLKIVLWKSEFSWCSYTRLARCCWGHQNICGGSVISFSSVVSLSVLLLSDSFLWLTWFFFFIYDVFQTSNSSVITLKAHVKLSATLIWRVLFTMENTFFFLREWPAYYLQCTNQWNKFKESCMWLAIPTLITFPKDWWKYKFCIKHERSVLRWK